MLRKILDGVSAGLMITIGCSVYLACENKYVGAVMFAVALLTICYKGLSLFTGKVGYIPENHSKDAVSTLLLGLLGNAIATIGFGTLIGLALPSLKETAIGLYQAKLTQELWQTLIRAVFCGVLMYVAVSVYRDNKTIAGIVFAVPVFILSGFEHSIADMCYFAISMQASFDAFVFILVVILGNALGGMLLPILQGKLKIGKMQDNVKTEAKKDEKTN
ncbi:MAG: formate/nitrite transporter family protein [Clostridiales bacterium]|nr:formate/nitrite transporter family protein [Clostridiales bacterium]MBQ3047347.1 formate/nitrite transporter family protein [Clostridia bacterium]